MRVSNLRPATDAVFGKWRRPKRASRSHLSSRRQPGSGLDVSADARRDGVSRPSQIRLRSRSEAALFCFEKAESFVPLAKQGCLAPPRGDAPRISSSNACREAGLIAVRPGSNTCARELARHSVTCIPDRLGTIILAFRQPLGVRLPWNKRGCYVHRLGCLHRSGVGDIALSSAVRPAQRTLLEEYDKPETTSRQEYSRFSGTPLYRADRVRLSFAARCLLLLDSGRGVSLAH